MIGIAIQKDIFGALIKQGGKLDNAVLFAVAIRSQRRINKFVL